MKFKKLVLCLFPTLLTAPSLANTINLSPGDNVTEAVQSAHSGDTVIFGAGTYNLNSPVTIPSGVTVTGISPNDSHINFNLPGGDNGSYGFNLAYEASNVTIEQLDLHSNHGVIRMANGNSYNGYFSNVTITYNNFQYGGGLLSGGVAVYGISGSLPSDGLQITHNYFHDSQNSNRNWCIFYATNSHFDYNLFYNIQDGGQLQYPGENVTFNYNYGTLVHRMCQESAATTSTSISYVGNVFYDWWEPYTDSFGISIVHACGEVNFTNNYFAATKAPGSGWGGSDGSGVYRFGFAFESTGSPCNVSNNTFVGYWACDVCTDSTSTNCWDNTVYGGALWGEYDGQDGGLAKAWDNSTQNVDSAPQPPANTFAGPAFGSEESTSSAKVISSAKTSTSKTTTSSSKKK